MIVDGAKEMRLGEFAQKCKEATWYLQSTKPYSPWSNSTKREIRELKKGTTNKLTWLVYHNSGPKWSHLPKWSEEKQAYINKHNQHRL